LITVKRELHGRRVGRPLRHRGLQAVQELLPRLRVPLTASAPIDPRALFDHPVTAVWLEIGSGDGVHAVWQAARNPDVGYIAVEPFVNGMASLVAAASEQGLGNIRVLDDDVRLLLELLAPGSVDRAFILFPDPWPKRRHWRRRIVNAEVLDQLGLLMPVGAELRVATDVPDYLVWMLRVLRDHPDFDWLPSSADDWRVRPDDWPGTRFEAKGLEAGRRSTYLSLQRSSSFDYA
jgi:tRNA (guanine-N7-)-methyltransferase